MIWTRTPDPRPVSRISLTLSSSVYWGFLQYQQFYSEELRGLIVLNPFNAPEAFLGGLPGSCRDLPEGLEIR